MSQLIEQINAEKEMLIKSRESENLTHTLLSRQLVDEYGKSNFNAFDYGIKLRINNYYAILYEKHKPLEKQPNRIGVVGGDYIEKVMFYLVSEFVARSCRGTSLKLEVDREIIVKNTKEGINKRLDIVCTNPDNNMPVFGIETKSGFDHGVLQQCYKDFCNLDGKVSPQFKYFCFGPGLWYAHNKTMQKHLEIQNLPDKNWIFSLPQSGDNTIADYALPQGIGKISTLFQEIDKSLKSFSSVSA